VSYEPYRHQCPACQAWLLPIWTPRAGEPWRKCPRCRHQGPPETFRPSGPRSGDDESDEGLLGPSTDEQRAFAADMELLQ
jgi:hypothetical protein